MFTCARGRALGSVKVLSRGRVGSGTALGRVVGAGSVVFSGTHDKNILLVCNHQIIIHQL